MIPRWTTDKEEDAGLDYAFRKIRQQEEEKMPVSVSKTEREVYFQFPNGSFFYYDAGTESTHPDVFYASDRGWTDFQNANFHGTYEGELVEYEVTTIITPTGRKGKECFESDGVILAAKQSLFDRAANGDSSAALEYLQQFLFPKK